MRVERLTDHFRVRTDGGQIVEVDEYTEFLDATTSGGTAQVAGVKRYQTAHGEAVNEVGGEYEIVTSRGPVRARRV
jgi:hypothetical protein